MIGWLVVAALLAAAPVAAQPGAPRVVDLPCVPDPVFPPDCVERLGPLGDALLERTDHGFRNVVAPVVDPLLLLGTPSGPDGRLYALNPTADRVRVYDTAGGGLTVRADIETCRRPSALAQSRSGHEVYVACHGSAGIAVIDTTRERVVGFVQDRDENGRPRLVEPMGMVVRDETLYVASSQNDRLAVVDLGRRRVRDYVRLPGRDPRSLSLAGGGRYLIVAHFLAGNRTEPAVELHPAVRDEDTAIGAICAPLLSAPETAALFDETAATFQDRAHPRYAEAAECYLFGHTFGSSSRIVPELARPDHDVAVVDLDRLQVVFSTDRLGVDLGAVNYHVTTAPDGRTVYLVSTAARNHLGPAFGERPLVNRLSILTLDPATGALALDREVDLDAPAFQAPGAPVPVAIPAAVARHADELLIAGLGSDALVRADPGGRVRTSIPVGFGPRGIVADGDAAYTFDATGLTVSRVDLARGRVVASAPLGPSPLGQPDRIGARLFHSARFAPRRNFACASCHPDGHQDGLVWELNDRDGLRTTLPVNGIADTAPYHWDGSKCNLHDIVQDSVADLFRNPTGPDPCEQAMLIAWMNGLARPASPYRATDDRLSAEAALGSSIAHRARFADPSGNPAPCSGRHVDPAIEGFLLDALGDPTAATFRFNGGGGPLPSTRSSESCGLANCHVRPHHESDGFSSGDPTAGLIDGYQAVSTDGVWDRALTQHDGRTMRTALLRALAINREHHGAPAAGSDPGRLPAQAFNDASFRHAEYHFDGRPDTHGFALTDALTRWMLEEQSPESAAVGLVAVVTASGPEHPRELEWLLDAAGQRKIGLEGHGTLQEAATRLRFDPADERVVAPDGTRLGFAELTSRMTERDVVVFRGGLLPASRDGGPRLLSLGRDRSPIRCAEDPLSYPATVTTGETGATLRVRAEGIAPGTRMVVDGKVTGEPLVEEDALYAWQLPRAPEGPAILFLQLLGPDGRLSNGLPVPVVRPVAPAGEPRDLALDRHGSLTGLRWRDPFGRTGPGTTYDVFRGDLRALRSGEGLGECITPAEWAANEITDGQVPPPQSGWFYVVRSQNQLGASAWGRPGRDRRLAVEPATCPLRYNAGVPEAR